VLHLHGTDIRRQWKAPETRDIIQRTIDGASAVYYPNLDTAEAATTARPDAVHMPIIVDTGILPVWAPSSESGRPIVLFVSRWDDSKGVENQLAVARALREALPQDARILGLDWGPGASAAAEAGVELVSRRSHDRFLELIARADVAVAQSSGVLATSELEAMAIGPALVVPIPSIADDGDPAPVLKGTPSDVVEQTVAALFDPRAASSALSARGWVEKKHTGDRWIPELERVYRRAANGG
jgi:glycosyltransferase involved in cell wall biosynthesis